MTPARIEARLGRNTLARRARDVKQNLSVVSILLFKKR